MKNEAMKYIAYYRVSTDKQGNSGLGLDAQRSDVRRFIHPDEIHQEFTEVESGRKKERAILLEAIKACKELKATLVIANLSRLARNVSFISTLMESGVKFVCADMPHATDMTIHIYAAIAQDEADRISERTKKALAEKQKQGIKLGSPKNLTDHSRRLAVRAIQYKAETNENNVRAKAMIKALKSQGLTLQAIADQLNASGFKTSKGRDFKPMQVKRLLPICPIAD